MTTTLVRRPANASTASPTLRGYQKRAVRDVERALARVRSVLLVEFMGAGKTVEAAEIVRRYAARGQRVLVLAHRGEILKQTSAKLRDAGIAAEDIGFIWALGKMNAAAPVQIASVATLARREAPDRIGLLVIDEAHHCQAESWKKILGWYPEAKVLGLTATPERLDGKPLGEFFEEMVLGEPCSNLIEAGYLTRPEIWTREDQWRPTKLRKASGGDYAAKEAARAMSGSTIVGGIAKAYAKHAKGLPAVCFVATQEQGKGYIDAFRKVGAVAETLFDSDAQAERDAKLERHRTRKTNVLITCDLLGEGWDYPGCRCVIMARPTASLARYMQWAGRAMRPGGRAVILDHAGNYHQGPPWEDREWTLEGRPKGSLMVPQIDREGGVSYLEPREVGGKLVRADTIVWQTECFGWNPEKPDEASVCPKGEKPSRGAFFRSEVKRRKGPWRCISCARRKVQGSRTPEKRSEVARKGLSARTPEQRHESARKASLARTPEQRHEMARKASAGMTPEQRKEMMRKHIAALTPGQRSEWVNRLRKGSAGMTPEQRSEASRKAWVTRRAKLETR